MKLEELVRTGNNHAKQYTAALQELRAREMPDGMLSLCC
jgi:hypothetical protein